METGTIFRLAKPFLTLLTIGGFSFSANAIEFFTAYEPFTVTLFEKELVQTYESGTLTNSAYRQGESSLLFHCVSFRIKQDWPFVRGWRLGFETGMSGNPLSTRKFYQWDYQGSNFTGTIVGLETVSGMDFWGGSRNISGNGNYYLIEDMNLAYVPFELNLKKILADRGSWKILGGTNMGFSIAALTLDRELQYTGQRPTFSRHSFVHVLQNVGVNADFEYSLTSQMTGFLNVETNGVFNLSYVESGSSDFIEGYRFDGLRYNVKFGVSWKI
ncbi:MAG: hypothetical protein HY547_04945 [Elusimicrobia bacterium]|nr:hypothetical protein [Elusimicrobiota bacterium]